MKENLLTWYGCLPPWFPKYGNLTCETDRSIKQPDEAMIEEIKTQIYKVVKEFEFDIFKTCLPPCISMNLRLKEMMYVSNRQKRGMVQLKIVDKVGIQTGVYAYDEFSLVVDLGSALGLWLGLSAVSIFDSMIEIFCNLRTKYFD